MTKLEEDIAKRACEIIISNRNESLGEGGEKVRTDFFGNDPDYQEYQFDPMLLAAAEVAKQYIEKAAKDASIYALANGYHSSAQIERWMKENGITE